MASPSINVSYWVGEPQPVEDEFCPNCLISSLVQVPFYTFHGGEIADILMNGGSLSVQRRFACNNGCDYRRTENL